MGSRISACSCGAAFRADPPTHTRQRLGVWRPRRAKFALIVVEFVCAFAQTCTNVDFLQILSFSLHRQRGELAHAASGGALQSQRRSCLQPAEMRRLTSSAARPSYARHHMLSYRRAFGRACSLLHCSRQLCRHVPRGQTPNPASSSLESTSSRTKSFLPSTVVQGHARSNQAKIRFGQAGLRKV